MGDLSFWYNQVMMYSTVSSILTGLFLGQIPNYPRNTPEDIEQFINNVNPERPLGLVVSVVEPDELTSDAYDGVTVVTPDDWKKRAVPNIQLDMRDFSADVDLSASVQAVLAMRQCILEGKAVYVHCKAGRARSAMLCAVYMVLFETDPETGAKYTLEKAIATLVAARPQVDVCGAKKATAAQIIAAAQKTLATYEEKPSEAKGVDQSLKSQVIKGKILKLPALEALKKYGEQVNTHYFKTSHRTQCVLDILALIAKPNSEEWFYALRNAAGPFKELLAAKPNHAEKNDQTTREELVTDLQKAVLACLEGDCGLTFTSSSRLQSPG